MGVAKPERSAEADGADAAASFFCDPITKRHHPHPQPFPTKGKGGAQVTDRGAVHPSPARDRSAQLFYMQMEW